VRIRELVERTSPYIEIAGEFELKPGEDLPDAANARSCILNLR
jgi:hypothetical protein